MRTLKAVHSEVAQANYYKSVQRGGALRREPVENVHPVVRRHPVTGEEALYVNKEYTRHIVGLKREESGQLLQAVSEENTIELCLLDTILNFLFDHIAKNADSQARVKWEPFTVVLWDNRVTTHVCLDFLFLYLSDLTLPSLLLSTTKILENVVTVSALLLRLSDLLLAIITLDGRTILGIESRLYLYTAATETYLSDQSRPKNSHQLFSLPLGSSMKGKQRKD